MSFAATETVEGDLRIDAAGLRPLDELGHVNATAAGLASSDKPLPPFDFCGKVTLGHSSLFAEETQGTGDDFVGQALVGLRRHPVDADTASA